MTTPLLLYAAVLLAGSVATWFGSVRLESGAAYLSRRYGLPALVQGTLVVAVASSLPEVVTVVASAAVHGDFALGMASIVGSAIFNVLVIPGVSALVGDRGSGLTTELRLVYRDALFYLTSVAVLLLTFSFAIIYRPVGGEGLRGHLTRGPALVPLLLYGLYLFLQQQEVAETEDGGGARDAAADGEEPSTQKADARGGGREGDPALDPSPEDAGSPETVGRAWLRMGLGIGLVVVGVEGLLRVALGLGDLLGTASFLWGATVVAAATSVPDAIISIRSARRGEGEVSAGNVLGSNIFDLLVAIPAGVLVAGATVVDYRVAAPLVAFLTLATVTLFTTLRTRLRLDPGEGWALLGLYACFVAWLALETAGVSDILGAG
jgi:cation:H+ antiporter